MNRDASPSPHAQATINRAQSVLNEALLALERTTGLLARVAQTSASSDRLGQEEVEIATEQRKYRFGAEVKLVDRFETPAVVKARGLKKSPLLVAPYITRQVAEHCRRLHQPFIDTAGNAYLERPGLLVFVVGQARPHNVIQQRFTALNPAGMQIAFALLCDPALIHGTYRDIAGRAGVSLGTVGPVMKDLEARQFLRFQKNARTFLNPERMLEEWVTHYPATLRLKLNPRFFQADTERLRQLDLTLHHASWGGEPAAEKLTQYLKPLHFTIYASEPVNTLVAAGRLRADEKGNVEILDKFWRFDAALGSPDLVPPVLAYADLLASYDDRNVEAARIVYEQRIAPTFRSSQ